MDNVAERIKEELRLISFQCARVVQYIMESERGINDKVGVNTLIDSDIYNQIDIEQDDWGVIKLLINSYIESIESGCKPGYFPSPEAIARWCQKKGIPSDNSTVYAICMSIFKYGISPRPIMNPSFDYMDEQYWDEWSDNLFNDLTINLDDFFNN